MQKKVVATSFLLLSSALSFCKTDQKHFVKAKDFWNDSFLLAKKVYTSGFKPTVLISIWRGGAVPGVTIAEYFNYKKCPVKKQFVPRVSAYSHDKLKSCVEITGFESIVKSVGPKDRILIIDDVLETGASVKSILDALSRCGEKNCPAGKNIKVATVYYKPKKSSMAPDFYVNKTNRWLVFPHELEGLTEKEVGQRLGGKTLGQLGKETFQKIKKKVKQLLRK